MSKHTPGPWAVHRHHKPISDQWIFTVITDEEYGNVICGTCTAPQWLDEATRQSNAALISAAPDLLEALEAFERISALWLPAEVEEQHAEEMYVLHMARNQMLAAIAKARGEA